MRGSARCKNDGTSVFETDAKSLHIWVSTPALQVVSSVDCLQWLLCESYARRCGNVPVGILFACSVHVDCCILFPNLDNEKFVCCQAVAPNLTNLLFLVILSSVWFDNILNLFLITNTGLMMMYCQLLSVH